MGQKRNPILKGIMKEKEKHNIELEQAHNKILELSSLRDSSNIPCIIITPPPTANEENYESKPAIMQMNRQIFRHHIYLVNLTSQHQQL